MPREETDGAPVMQKTDASMNPTIDGLRRQLRQIQDFAGEGTLLSLSVEERASLIEDARKLLHKLDALADSVLTVGLLGGTGVGKSSIMNALAGGEISSASHRRPHTDSAVIYHHSGVELAPALRLSGVPSKDVEHNADAIRQIILCDLPDFDSLLGEHCDHVVRFLEHLDLLAWVTSPEKYADARFYEFLRRVTKARENFFFVLNKVDLLFSGSLEAGYEQLERVVSRFRRHLEENGIEQPLIYPLSAADIVGARPAPWNQFDNFKFLMFRQRDAKTVLTIKSANLDVEMDRLVEKIEKEVSSYELSIRFIRDFIGELEADRDEWIQIGHEAFHHWLAMHFDSWAFQMIMDPSPLVGPSYLVGVLARELRSRGKSNGERAAVPIFEDEGAGVLLQSQMERIENRAVHQTLVRGIPPALSEELKDVLDVRNEGEKLGRRLQDYIQIRVREAGSESFRWFVTFQYAIYSIFLIFLLFALGGESAWHDVILYPNGLHFARLVTRMIDHVYGPIGIAALGSYVIMLVITGLWFFGRFRKILQRRKQKFIETLKLELEGLWLEQLDGVLHRLRELERQVQARMSALASFHTVRKKD
jgi:hypothetical protein